MNSHFKIIVDFQSLGKTQSGIITGKIYLSCNNNYFPEIDWFDSVGVILEWWLNAVHEMIVNPEQLKELRFMEGPFWMELSVGRNNNWTLRCIQKRKENDIKQILEIDPSQLVADLIHISNKLILECDKNKWNTDDINKLKEAVLNFKRYHDKDGKIKIAIPGLIN